MILILFKLCAKFTDLPTRDALNHDPFER